MFLFFVVVVDVCFAFGQQPQLDSEDSILLNYVIIRNNYLLSEVQGVMFVAENSAGERVEFPCSSYTPGNLQMKKSDYEKLQDCTELMFCFYSDTDKYSKVSPTYYELPLSKDVLYETYVYVEIFDKVRVKSARKNRVKKVRASRVNNGLDYTAIYYTKRDSVFTVGPQI